MNSKQYGNHIEEQKPPAGDCCPPKFESENAKAFADAANFIREGSGTNESGFTGPDSAKAEQAQVVRLIEVGLARQVTDEELGRLQTISNDTSEHQVLLPLVGGKRVTKVTWPGVYGQIPIIQDGKLDRRLALPSEYLDRQALQNEIFASDLKLEGVNISDRDPMVLFQPRGEPSFVVSQGFIQAIDNDNPSPSAQQIAAFLREHEFEPVLNAYFGWIRKGDNVAIVDAKPDNFILSVEGVVPIDLQMARISDGFGESFESSSIIIPA